MTVPIPTDALPPQPRIPHLPKESRPPPGGIRNDMGITLFRDAEEAWFWYMRCQKARWDGARFVANSSLAVRPCDPDDIYRAVMALYRQRTLSKQHLRTLAEFGLKETSPDPRNRDELRSSRLWDEALDFLTTVLHSKNLLDDGSAQGY